MSYERFVALRYLKAKRANRYISVITWIGLLGVAIGSCALIVVLSVMGGFEEDLKGKILGANAHIRVRPDKPQGPRWFTEEETAQVLETARKVPGVVGATPYVRRDAMITAQSNLSALVVKGIDLQTAPEVTFVAEKLVEPPGAAGLQRLAAPEQIKPPDYERFDADQGKQYPGLLVGRELQKLLMLGLGERVTLTSPTGGVGPTGRKPRNRPFRVAGVFVSGFYEYDYAMVYTTREEARRLFRLGGDTAVEIKVEQPEDAAEVAADLRAALGPGFEVRDWGDMNSSLFSALKLEKIAMFIILTLIVVVASFNIAVRMTLMVTEKRREIGILKSMGATSGSIRRIFALNGLIIGGGGTALGVGLGLAACWIIAEGYIPMNEDVYYYANLPVAVNPVEVGATIVAALLISVLATLYPATKAASQDPVEGLRFG